MSKKTIILCIGVGVIIIITASVVLHRYLKKPVMNVHQPLTPDAPHTSSNDRNNLVWQEIPEMGITLKVYSHFAGKLEYSFEEKVDSISGKTYQTADFYCGILSKHKKGEIDLKDPFVEGRPYKEIGDSYIIYWSPQDVCEDPQNTPDLITALDSIKLIEKQ